MFHMMYGLRIYSSFYEVYRQLSNLFYSAISVFQGWEPTKEIYWDRLFLAWPLTKLSVILNLF